MDNKTTSLIKKILRRGSLQHGPRNEAKKGARIAPALYKCACGCGTAVFESKSKKNLEKLRNQFPDLWILIGTGHIDHIKPVREGKDSLDWNDYINSLFCGVDNLQYLSPACHEKKSELDRQLSGESPTKKKSK